MGDLNKNTLGAWGSSEKTQPVGGYIHDYAADGALKVEPGVGFLTKATAGAYTLALPTLEQDGLVLSLVSKTAVAHVVTTPAGGITDGTSSVKIKGTFAAYIGAQITLMASGGKWVPVGNTAVTLAAS